ncbi:hypothetical protein PIB30_019042 [Stylosanthes scabra]|uniref:Uncharacterized protein n=1 Tax=Stylosanthes scabra TaxID=79078 RepID=A0ABU6S9I5_9FABA|nr:hypothetical protein [Stylosanthes scabra]
MKAQLSNITELLSKFTSQMTIKPQPSHQPSNSNELLSQTLPNPKDGINVVQSDGVKEEDEEEDVGEEELLYKLSAELASEESSDDEEESEEDEVESADKEEVFFAVTVYRGIGEIREESTEKCADPASAFIIIILSI